MQFVSSTALTVMSITVSVVAATFGYRSLNGWKPVVLSSGARMGELKKPGVFIGTTFEIWNRRKYAILVRQVQVDFGSFKLKEFVNVTTGPSLDEEWHMSDSSAKRWDDFFIEPNEHKRFDVDVKFEPSGDYLTWPEPQARIRVLFFDVKKNKHIVLEKVAKKRRDFPMLR